MAETQIVKVGDMMTKDVLAIDANDTLDVIASLFEKYGYDGMPVIDADHKLMGIITEHDLMLQSTEMHLPTLLKIIDQITANRADKRSLDEHFGKLRDIKATSIMNPKVAAINPEASLEDAARIFADHSKVNPLCVVDAENKLVGIISRYDVIKFFNEAYLQRVVEASSTLGTDLFKEFPTKTSDDVEKAVQGVQEGFVLVTKRRPLIWKYIAFAAFAAGLVAATALIIRIVQKSG